MCWRLHVYFRDPDGSLLEFRTARLVGRQRFNGCAT
jgi:hypothetical protein